MKPFFSRNIDNPGRLVRGLGALVLLVGAGFGFTVSVWLGLGLLGWLELGWLGLELGWLGLWSGLWLGLAGWLLTTTGPAEVAWCPGWLGLPAWLRLMPRISSLDRSLPPEG